MSDEKNLENNYLQELKEIVEAVFVVKIPTSKGSPGSYLEQDARRVFCHIAKKKTSYPFTEISKFMNRSVGSASNSYNKCESLLDVDVEFSRKYKTCFDSIKKLEGFPKKKRDAKGLVEIIYKACCDATGLDISIKTRKRNYVLARCVYYSIAKDLTIDSLSKIGETCGGRDHATVLHGLKKYDREKNMKDLKLLNRICRSNMPSGYSRMSKSKEDLELNYLYSNKSRLERQVKILKERLADDILPDEILCFINLLNTEQLKNLIQYRIVPFVKMHTQTPENTRNSNVKIVN